MKTRVQRVAGRFLAASFWFAMGIAIITIGGCFGAIVAAAMSGFSAQLPEYAAVPIVIGCALGLITWIALMVSK